MFGTRIEHERRFRSSCLLFNHTIHIMMMIIIIVIAITLIESIELECRANAAMWWMYVCELCESHTQILDWPKVKWTKRVREEYHNTRTRRTYEPRARPHVKTQQKKEFLNGKLGSSASFLPFIQLCASFSVRVVFDTYHSNRCGIHRRTISTISLILSFVVVAFVHIIHYNTFTV